MTTEIILCFLFVAIMLAFVYIKANLVEKKLFNAMCNLGAGVNYRWVNFSDRELATIGLALEDALDNFKDHECKQYIDCAVLYDEVFNELEYRFPEELDEEEDLEE